MITTLEALRARYGSVANDLTRVGMIREWVSQRPIEPLFEPCSAVDLGAGALIMMSPETVEGWAKHIAYACRGRMRALEHAILLLLSQGCVVAPMMIVRGHLETAGLAAYSDETLRSGEWDQIARLIPKTLFGNSLVRTARKDPAAADLLNLTEQEPVEVGKLIAAMDRLSEGGVSRFFQRSYALFSNFAHPNQPGVKHIIENVQIVGDQGWRITYGIDERLTEDHVRMAVETLAESMKIGHSACELLRLTRFEPAADGLALQRPSETQLREIWAGLFEPKRQDSDGSPLAD